MTEVEVESASAQTLVPMLVHLSGNLRGQTELLAGDSIPLQVVGRTAGTQSESDRSPAATLHRRGQSYQIVATPGESMWVNGEMVDHLVLASGDVVELGQGGPVLRFRLHTHDRGAHKSITEVFSDCWACARYEEGGLFRRTAVLLGGVPMELATQTTRAFRVGVAFLFVALIAYSVTLSRRSTALERSFAAGQATAEGLATFLANSESSIPEGGFLEVIEALRDSLQVTTTRLGALENRGRAAVEVIAAVSQAVIYLQGSFGFVDPKSRRPLRFRLGADGTPGVGADGAPLVGLEGDGPVVEAFYSGTAFLVGDSGLALTNRHVSAPWENDEGAAMMMRAGWRPVMHRFTAYLPGLRTGLPAEALRMSDVADVAVLRIHLPERRTGLTLAETPPRPGDEVLLLGYPLGVRALMARTDAKVVAGLVATPGIDLWTVAARLAAGGHITPLASRGIVAQVTEQAIAYDAQTTHGGSGGPVLTVDGKVVAVNMAILPEFGGSNLGVPVIYARALLGLVH